MLSLNGLTQNIVANARGFAIYFNMPRTFTTADFQEWGRKGGKRGGKKLTSARAKAMVREREKKRAMKRVIEAAAKAKII
jgi:hypothetical protein